MEFERWVDTQRRGLARRAATALITLAERAAAGEQHRPATDWWRRAAEVDPYDSRTALGLVESLAAAGDRAGALLAARRHEELLAQELGVRPDPQFTTAVARLR